MMEKFHFPQFLLSFLLFCAKSCKLAAPFYRFPQKSPKGTPGRSEGFGTAWGFLMGWAGPCPGVG